MTFKIPRSQMPPDFEVMVAGHASEMKAWRAHMRRVADDEKNGVTGIDRHMAHPAPSSHPIVAAAVDENDNANYEIVDDSQQLLARRKLVLIAEVSEAQQATVDKIIPRGKRHLYNLREEEIRQAAAPRGIAGKVAQAIGFGSQISDGDRQFLEDQKSRSDRIAVAGRIAAQAMHDIEDLTVDTVDGWTAPVFPT
jgi:hypothetical protein